MKRGEIRLPRHIHAAAVFVAIILFMEIVLRALMCTVFFSVGLCFMPLFSLAAGLLIEAVCRVPAEH